MKGTQGVHGRCTGGTQRVNEEAYGGLRVKTTVHVHFGHAG